MISFSFSVLECVNEDDAEQLDDEVEDDELDDDDEEELVEHEFGEAL